MAKNKSPVTIKLSTLAGDMSIRGREMVWRKGPDTYKCRIARTTTYMGAFDIDLLAVVPEYLAILSASRRSWTAIPLRNIEVHAIDGKLNPDGSIELEVVMDHGGMILPKNQYYPPKRISGTKS